MKWIRLSEQLPCEDENVLFTDGTGYFIGEFDKTEGFIPSDSRQPGHIDMMATSFIYEACFENITHWMTLPALPDKPE